MTEISLARSLRDLRERRGLSLSETARRAGTTKGSLQHWEHGRNVPSGAALDRLIKALEAGPRLRARLLALADPRHAQIALAGTPLGAPVDVGMVLRAMRNRRGMTQTELARVAGVTQGTIAKWESGASAPSAEAIHALGFALGAMVEETLALASARDVGAGEVPWDIDEARLTIRLKYLPAPLVLQDVVSLGWEAEMWRRASRDARWEPLLARVLAYRTNQFVLDGRFDEIPALSRRVLRLATGPDGWPEVVPAVGSLAFLAERRGEDATTSIAMAEAWAARLPDSEMRAWMLRTQGSGLIQTGRREAGLDLVRRSIDMDERHLYPNEPEENAWRTRAMLMAKAYLSAELPERAAQAVAERDMPIDHMLTAEIAQASGRLASERDLAEARRNLASEVTACAFAYGNWWSRRRLDRIERTQARLLRLGRPVAA